MYICVLLWIKFMALHTLGKYILTDIKDLYIYSENLIIKFE